MFRNPSLPNALLHASSSLLPPRAHPAFRKQLLHLSRLLKSPRAGYLQLAVVFVLALLLYLFIPSVTQLFTHPQSPFDDVADMRLVAEEEAEYIRQKLNASSFNSADPFRLLNATDIREARKSFDYIYGEVVRKPVPPVFTKYKTRLMRELYARTHYILAKKLAPSLDVSCNYLNAVDDTGSLYTFRCSDTSHRCPDGAYSVKPAFAPAEGTSITWSQVIIVLLVSAGRESFLEAAADTWISRLHPDATLFIARDQLEPVLPQSIMHRRNTYIYAYPGPTGLQYLDIKAFETWNKVFELFSTSGKKYFLKIDDDSFLFGHNLIRFLNKLEHWFSGREQAIYFGHPFCGHGDLKALGYATWCYAGGGAYGLSIEALQIMLTQIKGGCVYFYDYVRNGNGRPVEDRYGGRYEDVMIGRCLRQARTRTQNRGTSLLACGSFFPYAPLHYYNSFGQSKEAMCRKLDGDPITIHNLAPSAIRYLEHIFYEYPLGGEITPFSAENERMDEMIRVCQMDGKKMSCDLSQVPSI